jgi:hypothetical protein
MNIEWKIIQLDRKIDTGFVQTAHWTATAVDGVFSASTYGTCGFDGKLITPYENLTEEQVLGWIWANGVNQAETERGLAAQLEIKKHPISATGIPWKISSTAPAEEIN